MFRVPLFVSALALLILAQAFVPATAASQANVPEEMRAHELPRQKLSGPRVGFTTFTGDVASGRRDLGKSTLMSQFGWQFETQIVSTESGHQALLEVVLLLGGLEQDEFNLNASWLAGYRLANGLEFGVGPNLSRSSITGDFTTSLVTAAGITLAVGDMYLPFTAALAFAEGGPRITTLMGWIIG